MAYNPRLFGGGFGSTGGGGFTGGGGGAFNLNPAPQGGSGAFGRVPGAVGMPVNRFTQTGGAIPGFSGSTAQVGANILRDLSGDIDWNEIQDEAARFGVQSGMPGSPFSGVRGLHRGEEAVNRRRMQGFQEYLAALQSVGASLDDPNLAAQLATQNAVWRSAPDPESAADEQMRRWQEQFDKISGTGSGGYSGVWGPGEGTVSAGLSGANFGLGGGVNPSGFGAADRPSYESQIPMPQSYGMPAGATPAPGYDPSIYDRWHASIVPNNFEDDDPFADFFEGYNYLDDPEEIPNLAGG